MHDVWVIAVIRMRGSGGGEWACVELNADERWGLATAWGRKRRWRVSVSEARGDSERHCVAGAGHVGSVAGVDERWGRGGGGGRGGVVVVVVVEVVKRENGKDQKDWKRDGMEIVSERGGRGAAIDKFTCDGGSGWHSLSDTTRGGKDGNEAKEEGGNLDKACVQIGKNIRGVARTRATGSLGAAFPKIWLVSCAQLACAPITRRRCKDFPPARV